jgi:hypothetical protein
MKREPQIYRLTSSARPRKYLHVDGCDNLGRQRSKIQRHFAFSSRYNAGNKIDDEMIHSVNYLAPSWAAVGLWLFEVAVVTDEVVITGTCYWS